jgi:DnaJ-class molecular chaperone
MKAETKRNGKPLGNCETCGGSGDVHSHNPICWTCDGTGWVPPRYTPNSASRIYTEEQFGGVLPDR